MGCFCGTHSVHRAGTAPWTPTGHSGGGCEHPHNQHQGHFTSSSPSHHPTGGPRDPKLLSLQKGNVLGLPEANPRPRFVSCVWAQPPALPSTQEAAKPQPRAGQAGGGALSALPMDGIWDGGGIPAIRALAEEGFAKPDSHSSFRAKGKIGFSTTLRCPSASGMRSTAEFLGSALSRKELTHPALCPVLNPAQQILALPP